MTRLVAVLDTMWDPGANVPVPYFRISPANHSGRRLYELVGEGADLYVTNACREHVSSAGHHGLPDPAWLLENLLSLEPIDVLLLCGRVAQATFLRIRYPGRARIVRMPHPAARTWTREAVERYAAEIDEAAA